MAKIQSMPYNLEAEQSVLGCVLIDQVIQSDILSEVQVDDFLVESHKLIYETMKGIYGGSSVIDMVTLCDRLQKAGWLEKVGGISYITELTQVIPSSANFFRYVEIVKRDSILRKLITSSNEIIADASTSVDSKRSLLLAEEKIFNISDTTRKQGLEHINPFLQPVIEKFERIEKDKDFLNGIKTGFSHLDYLTNGLHPGNLIILAARPSVGKTTLAMNFVENIAMKEKATVAVFALEMTKEELAQRMLCSVANVSMEKALKGKLSATEPGSYQRLWNAQKRIEQTKIFIDESSQVTPQDILSKCRRLKLKYGLDLIVVDHIQLMDVEDISSSDGRQQQVTKISRGLKMIAKEMNVPVIALSQLSRQVSQRKGGKPILSDLRESGAIEQDADLVMFIHRPEKDADASEKKNLPADFAEIIIAKNRNGACGDVELRFKGEYVKFVEPTKNEEQYGKPPAEYKAKTETGDNGDNNGGGDADIDSDVPPPSEPPKSPEDFASVSDVELSKFVSAEQDDIFN